MQDFRPLARRPLPWLSLGASLALAALAVAQQQPPATRPTSMPATTQAESINDYDRLLGSDVEAREQPILPDRRATIDRATGSSAVAPIAPELNTRREGSFLLDRVGYLSKVAGTDQWEFIFKADANALQDPPMRVLPNLKLQTIEDELSAANRNLKLRVSGTVTEYRGRNYLLLEKVIVARDPS